MTSKELPVPDPHRQAVPGPQSKGGQDASWAWSSDSDEGGATLPASRGRSRTLTRSGCPLSTSPSQACSQSHSPGRAHGHGHLMTCGAWWFASGNCHHLLMLTCSAVISFPHLLHFQEADSTLGASERIHASASSQAWGNVVAFISDTLYKKCYKVYLQRNIRQNPMLTWHRIAEV